jgi:transcriptional regulator of acetoin/glycerol metabolism
LQAVRTGPMERSSQLPALWDGFPEPVVKIVERLVEKFVVPQDPQCLENLEEARRLLAAASERLTRPFLDSAAPLVLAHFTQLSSFPKLGEIERAMILAAYRRSNRKPLEAARLLGIGKTTLYRKLRAIGTAVKSCVPD